MHILSRLLHLFQDSSNQQSYNLALRAEAQAIRLNHLPSPPSTPASNDLITILESTCFLLDRLIERNDSLQSKIHSTPPAPASMTKGLAEIAGANSGRVSSAPQGDTSSSTPNVVALDCPPQPPLASPPAYPPLVEVEPSPTARELIKLRDWILMAWSGGGPVSAEVIGELYRQVGRILAKEGVTPLEETGLYDHNCQQILDTRSTDDLTLNDQVCDTVRPGYLFHGKLIRPQEVIVYLFEQVEKLE